MTIETFKMGKKIGHRSLLSNGLEVWTRQVKSEFAGVRIGFKVGSVHDGTKPGLAHFLEHMLFEGPSRDVTGTPLYALSIEACRSGASTGPTDTSYRLDGFADRDADMLATLLQMTFTPAFGDSRLEEERRVILQEMQERSHQAAFDRMKKQMLFPDVPEILHRPTGEPESVSAITMDDLRAFHSAWYRPETATVFYAGPRPHEEVVALVERAQLPSRGNGPPPPPAPRKLVVSRDEWRTPFVPTGIRILSWNAPLVADLEGRITAGLVMEALDNSLFGPLWLRLRRDTGMVYRVKCDVSRYPVAHTLDIVAHTHPSRFMEVEREVHAAIKDIRTGAYSNELIRFMRNQTRFDRMRKAESRSNPSAMADRLVGTWSHGLREDPFIDELAFLTEGHLAAFAETYFAPADAAVISVYPKT